MSVGFFSHVLPSASFLLTTSSPKKQAIVKMIYQAQKILAEIMQMCREHEHTMRICVGDPETFAPW